MWAQVDMNEFYKQFEEKKKRAHFIPVNFKKKFKGLILCYFNHDSLRIYS